MLRWLPSISHPESSLKHTITYTAFEGMYLVRETWRATSLFCPRCGNGQGHVWTLSEEANPTLSVTVKAGNHDVHLFLCVGCGFTGRGWGGYKPTYDTVNRVAEIRKLASSEEV